VFNFRNSRLLIKDFVILGRCKDVFCQRDDDGLFVFLKKEDELIYSLQEFEFVEWKGDYCTEIEMKIKCVYMCKYLIR
jgi:hypothetical protein